MHQQRGNYSLFNATFMFRLSAGRLVRVIVAFICTIMAHSNIFIYPLFPFITFLSLSLCLFYLFHCRPHASLNIDSYMHIIYVVLCSLHMEVRAMHIYGRSGSEHRESPKKSSTREPINDTLTLATA
jgi:hypothetical protein